MLIVYREVFSQTPSWISCSNVQTQQYGETNRETWHCQQFHQQPVGKGNRHSKPRMSGQKAMWFFWSLMPTCMCGLSPATGKSNGNKKMKRPWEKEKLSEKSWWRRWRFHMRCYVAFLIFQSSFNLSSWDEGLKACSAVSIGCKSCCHPLTWEKAFLLGKSTGEKESEKVLTAVNHYVLHYLSCLPLTCFYLCVKLCWYE